MSESTSAATPAERTAAARKRGCYCDLWDKKPALYKELGYQEGYCGVCETCGAPGHTRHFPGPLPYTGSWCDKCYRRLAWTWPLQTTIGRIGIIALLLAALSIASLFPK